MKDIDSENIGDIQILNNSNVTNKSKLGQLLQVFTHDDDNIALFPSHGFMDGGCLALAIGVKDWLGAGELSVVIDNGVIQHFALEIDDLFIDGDGIATKTDFIRKLTYLENLANPTLMTLDDWEVINGEFDQDEDMILDYMETNVPDEITKRLTRFVSRDIAHGLIASISNEIEDTDLAVAITTAERLVTLEPATDEYQYDTTLFIEKMERLLSASNFTKLLENNASHDDFLQAARNVRPSLLVYDEFHELEQSRSLSDSLSP